MKTVKQNTTEAQRRLLDKVIMANGLCDQLTLRMLTKKEQKSFYNLRSKALYICADANGNLILNVTRMITDTDFIKYVASKKWDVQLEREARLAKARKEQRIVNLLIRTMGLSAASKYKGVSIWNSIYTFYNQKEKRARTEESKKAARKERNEFLELSRYIDQNKTYAYSLDVLDFDLSNFKR
tara:strand:- start:107 stop:655 length:549 start_codon:yes stop_codon:yes gene_type:complete